MEDNSKRAMDFLFSRNKGVNDRLGWDDLDIGTLLNYYLFENTNVTQAEIAKELNLAPISVSRQIKNKKSRIKDEWKPVLTKYTYQLDLKYLKEQINVIEAILRQDLRNESVACARRIIDHYLNDQGLGNEIEYESADLPLGNFRFLNKATQKMWVFSVMSSDPPYASSYSHWEQNPSAFVYQILSRRSVRDSTPIERRIILCTSEELLSKICNEWNPEQLQIEIPKNEALYLCHVNAEEIIDWSYQLALK